MRNFLFPAILPAIFLSSAALAQDHSQMHHGMMEAPPAPDHSAHQPAPPPQMPAPDPQAGHHPAPPVAEIPAGKAPEPPTDHAADAVYNPAAMARARAAMMRESGGMSFSQIMIDRLEYRAGDGRDGYHWEGEGWIGGDINRFAVKTMGEGDYGRPLERAELQALYSRAVDPWFNLEAGLRHDIRSGADRTYAVIGMDGLAPYWFEVGAQAFLSDKGDVHLRLQGSYDQRIGQRLILQPALEVDIAAQDVPDQDIGSGLSSLEAGLRLRYEFAREFAPYVGINWERKLGDTARFARAEGEGSSATSFVIGLRFWF